MKLMFSTRCLSPVVDQSIHVFYRLHGKQYGRSIWASIRKRWLNNTDGLNTVLLCGRDNSRNTDWKRSRWNNQTTGPSLPSHRGRAYPCLGGMLGWRLLYWSQWLSTTLAWTCGTLWSGKNEPRYVEIRCDFFKIIVQRKTTVRCLLS